MMPLNPPQPLSALTIDQLRERMDIIDGCFMASEDVKEYLKRRIVRELERRMESDDE